MFKRKFLSIGLISLLFLIIFSLKPFISNAQAASSNELVGLERVASPVDGYSLVTMDSSTGQLTTTATYANPNFIPNAAAFNPNTNQLFVEDCPIDVSNPCTLYTIDSTTGAIIHSTPSEGVITLYVEQNNTLVGLERVASPVDGYNLATLDPNNGQLTTIATYANPNFIPYAAAFNPNTNQLFVEDCPGNFGDPCTLYTIDSTTGAIIHSTSSEEVTTLYVEQNNTLVGLERVASPVDGYNLVTMDPSNGQLTTIATYANPNFAPYDSIFNPNTNQLFVEDCGDFGDLCTLYNILATTGEVVSTVSSQHIHSFKVTTETNTVPTVGAISFSLNPAKINTSVTASANFTDSAGDTHTASWNWGDGNTIPGTVSETNGSGSISNNHIYTTLGSYTVTLTVTDNLGQSSTTSAVIAVIPTGGLQGGNLSGKNYSGANLSGLNISGANLSKGTFNNVNFASTNLSGSNGSQGSYTSSNFTSANLSGANFSKANFTGSNFTNANLTGANVSNANFTNVNVTGANLTGSNFHGAIMAGVIYSNTICPNGANSNSHNNSCAGQGGGL